MLPCLIHRLMAFAVIAVNTLALVSLSFITPAFIATAFIAPGLVSPAFAQAPAVRFAKHTAGSTAKIDHSELGKIENLGSNSRSIS